MAECNCPSGNYGCSCCCASVTGLRAGIHPDYIKSFYKDVAINDETTATYETFAITGEPIHIVSVTASLACVTRNEAAGESGEDGHS